MTQDKQSKERSNATRDIGRVVEVRKWKHEHGITKPVHSYYGITHGLFQESDHTGDPFAAMIVEDEHGELHTEPAENCKFLRPLHEYRTFIKLFTKDSAANSEQK